MPAISSAPTVIFVAVRIVSILTTLIISTTSAVAFMAIPASIPGTIAALVIPNRTDRRDIVIQAYTIQPVCRGINDLTAATIIGVLTNLPLTGPDIEG